MTDVDMTPQRPYLLRAFYDWILDNDCTPYLVANADYPDVMVPMQFVQDNQIVLNVSPSATQGLVINEHAIEFTARFGGKTQQLYIPCGAAIALYAKENGEGTAFPPEAFYDERMKQSELKGITDVKTDEAVVTDSSDEKKPTKKGRPTLTVVK